MRSACVGHGVAPHRVEATVVLCGPDVSVSFGGGEAPHIGAVALGVPRPSLTDPSARSASVSVLCVTGHKEDELARSAAHELATEFACRVNVTVGIHVDDATPDDIALLFENFSVTLSEVKRWLSQERAAQA
jgi:hypothetical protein